MVKRIPEEKAPPRQSTDLGELTRELLGDLVPTEDEYDDVSSALGTLGWRRTGAAMLVFCLWQKACKGDVSAAKLIRELSTEPAALPEGEDPEVSAETLSSMSDAELLRLLGGSLPLEKAENAVPEKEKRPETVPEAKTVTETETMPEPGTRTGAGYGAGADSTDGGNRTGRAAAGKEKR